MRSVARTEDAAGLSAVGGPLLGGDEAEVLGASQRGGETPALAGALERSDNLCVSERDELRRFLCAGGIGRSGPRAGIARPGGSPEFGATGAVHTVFRYESLR